MHCAEAPGGFIQGSNIYLNLYKDNFKKDETIIDEEGFIHTKKNKKNENIEKKIYTISLNKDIPQYKNYNLPSYNKYVMNKYVSILYGQDKTGNINNINNIIDISHKIHDKCYLVTGDGGFDEGNEYNNKEQLHYNLILNEIICCLQIQKQNGHFILKMFDIFTDTSLHLLYLLRICFKEVFIYKPYTSRPTNSEKYIICKYFIQPVLLKELIQLSKELYINSNITSFLLFQEIPTDFIYNIKNINHQLIQRQCHYLKIAIDLCNNAFFSKYDKHLAKIAELHKHTFKQWCNTYKYTPI